MKVDATELDDLARDLQAAKIDIQPANVSYAQLVVARSRVKASGEGRQAQAAARTMRVVKSAVRAEVTMGGPKAPWAPGSEFGAGQGRPRRRTSGSYRGFNQFKPWRGAGASAGYFMWPTIRATEDEGAEMTLNAVDEALAPVFPK